MSRAANAVSRRHGEVAREMWHGLWPERAVDEVPIGHVTNGVHVPTWIGVPMRELLDRHLPEGWCSRAADPAVWAAVDAIPARELWETRLPPARRRSSSFVRDRSVADRLVRGDVRGYVDAAARAFDPKVLTIGFARRVATYKRLEMLTRDPEWTLKLLDGDRPVQVVLAGKAHPRDEEAKRALQSVFGLKAARVVGERVVFLDDYDLASGAALVRGCDVWLNLPRPPLEASGTSGMKSVFNGGLQLIVLDGWWAEAYDGTQRLGDLRRGRSRPPRPGRARRRRLPWPARRAGAARVLRPRRVRDPGALGGDDAGLAAHARPAVLRHPDADGVRDGPYRG